MFPSCSSQESSSTTSISPLVTSTGRLGPPWAWVSDKLTMINVRLIWPGHIVTTWIWPRGGRGRPPPGQWTSPRPSGSRPRRRAASGPGRPSPSLAGRSSCLWHRPGNIGDSVHYSLSLSFSIPSWQTWAGSGSVNLEWLPDRNNIKLITTRPENFSELTKLN